MRTRTNGLVVGLLLSSMVVFAPMQANCVTHDNANNLAAYEMQMNAAQHEALTPSQPAEECYSYVQVFETIGQDPEHAEARTITPSYEIH